jgi:hypothetical protein
MQRLYPRFTLHVSQLVQDAGDKTNISFWLAGSLSRKTVTSASISSLARERATEMR